LTWRPIIACRAPWGEFDADFDDDEAAQTLNGIYDFLRDAMDAAERLDGFRVAALPAD
jgi:hypothetical protein